MSIAGSYDRMVGVVYNFEVSKQRGKDLWNTDDEFTFFIGEIAEQRYVTIPKAYLTDGASVPRFFWGMIPPWGVYGQAAVVHDYLCEFKKLTKNGDSLDRSLDQAKIDRVLFTAMKVSGTSWTKRALIYGAVRAWHILRL